MSTQIQQEDRKPQCRGTGERVLAARKKGFAYRGFTLIELLVVIAIIAILASILFPVFARARENARRASCQSNQKQIALGFMQYVQDYDGHFPNGWGDQVGWNRKIFPYVKSIQLFRCPSSAEPALSQFGGPKPGYENAFPTSYSLSWGFQVSGPPLYSEYLTGISEAAIQTPTNKILTMDNGANFKGTAPYWEGGNSTYKSSAWISFSAGNFSETSFPETDGNWSAPNPRHLDTVVVSFADGHVKSMKMSNFYTPDKYTLFFPWEPSPTSVGN